VRGPSQPLEPRFVQTYLSESATIIRRKSVPSWRGVARE